MTISQEEVCSELLMPSVQFMKYLCALRVVIVNLYLSFVRRGRWQVNLGEAQRNEREGTERKERQ